MLVGLLTLAFVRRQWSTFEGQVVFFFLALVVVGSSLALLTGEWDEAWPTLAAFVLAGILTYLREIHFRRGEIDAMKTRGDVMGLVRALRRQPVGREEVFRRREAATALGEIGDSRAAGPLVAALGDEEFGVPDAAEEALLRIGPAAVPPLIEVFPNAGPARGRMAGILGRIGDPRAVPPLVEALEDKDSDTLQRVAAALGAIEDARALQPLLRWASDKAVAFEIESALAAIVRSQATVLGEEDLQAIGTIPDEVLTREGFATYDHEGEIRNLYAGTSVDFRRLKDMARAELHRRGLDPPTHA